MSNIRAPWCPCRRGQIIGTVPNLGPVCQECYREACEAVRKANEATP